MQYKKLQFQKTLADIIKNKRKNKQELSINKSSNEVGLSKSVWSVIEQGKRDPQLSTIWRVAEALEIPLSKIIEEMEEQLGSDFFLEE